MEMYLNCKFLLKNTTYHVIRCGISLQVFLQLETLSEQSRKSKTVPHVFYDSAEMYVRQ